MNSVVLSREKFVINFYIVLNWFKFLKLNKIRFETYKSNGHKYRYEWYKN